jgi:PAS domain S-box-containing protein
LYDRAVKTQIDFGEVINSLLGLVCVTDADGRGSFTNRSWRDYTGRDGDESLDFGWQAAIHPEDLSALLAAWNAIKESGVAKEIDARLRRFDGEYRWFEFHASRLPQSAGDGARWSWLGVYADERPTLDGRLRRFFDLLPWQAGFLDAAGVLEFSNAQSLKDFQMTQEELEKWGSSGIIHAEDHEDVRSSLAVLLATGQMWDHHLRMRYPSGTYRWTRSRCLPVRDAQQNVVRYVTFQIDVDDLKRAQMLLAAEVNLLEMVATGEPLPRVLAVLSEHIEDLCIDWSCSILTLTADRSRFRVAAGSSLPEVFNRLLEGKRIDAAEDPCSLAVIARTPVVTADVSEDSRWQGTQWPRHLKDHGLVSCCAIPIATGSGEACGVIAVYGAKGRVPAPKDQELVDRFTKIAGIAIDRSVADAALREALSQLAEGQRLSKTGSFTWDVRADRLSGSQEIRRIFGFEADATITLAGIRDAVHPEDSSKFQRMIGEARDTGRDFELVFRILTTAGEWRHAHLVGHRVDFMTDRPVFIGALQDVTEREVAAEGLNLARAELAHVARVATLSAMTASIAHEVSQPIAGILTNASTLARMLAADPPNLPGANETVRRTIRDANRASEVVKRLRAMFSKKAPTLEEVDLNEAAREVVALSAGELRRVNAVLEVKLADGLPTVHGDRVQLQQVILNLLLNAADAMSAVDDRPRKVMIQTESDQDDSVKLSVVDTGVGIDPQAIEKLFDAFYTTKAHGMGVGLAISRSIIKSHQGRLWAQAHVGPGTTFAFTIPAAALGSTVAVQSA